MRVIARGALASLTERERHYLRLVHDGLSSKAIASLFNMRSDRVDKIINSARAKLGGVPRRDAARAVVAYEKTLDQAPASKTTAMPPQSPPTQSLGAQSLGLEHPTDILTPDPVATPTVEGESSEPRTWNTASSLASILALPLGSGGSGRNDLDRLPRLVAMLVIAAAGALTAGAVVSLLLALDQFATGH